MNGMIANKLKKISPFDIIRHINEKTDFEFDMSDYNNWMINRGLSFTKDTIFYANIVNQNYNLDKDLQYKFLFNGIPKGKRFGKWEKKTSNDEIIDILADYFCINKRVAHEYLLLLNDEQLLYIKNKIMRGGTK